ncbi:nuclear transport factor 2 family protein [Mesorhizobium sp. LHD-90]|uniref:nuclear transport factor 2 family protein n=1 Tax=Mesorhizobium sp. LHD-90 TaxID=3071414 RepID=UPI0027E04C22|nr:nuclear transport factor 2 family protein [Mesorhizobium sp. LHD-90]MDQ6432959.1 nuclear transport factor 2 family protein [Mesorhizobium sp. LHD-90]
MDPADLIDRYCAVWNEASPRMRAEMLSSVWADGATYTDPGVHAAGADELLDHIARMQSRRAGSQVIRTSDVDHHHGLARFHWKALAADGTVLREGIDIAFVNADGSRLDRIIGFFGSLA